MPLASRLSGHSTARADVPEPVPTRRSDPGARCPRCRTRLDDGAGHCDSCGTRFRSITVAALLSIGLPGAGHIYLRRRLLGALEMTGALFILATALVRLGTVFIEALEGRTPPIELMRVCIPWALLLGAYSIASGLFTWLASRHRRVPAGSPVRGAGSG